MTQDEENKICDQALLEMDLLHLHQQMQKVEDLRDELQ
jgi:hypothetical protein